MSRDDGDLQYLYRPGTSAFKRKNTHIMYFTSWIFQMLEEIAHLLDENIKKVDDIVTDTSSKVNQIKETGAQKISVGNETATKCKEVFEQISSIVLDVSQKIAEIDTASNEQAAGIKEVNHAMNSLREVTDQTSFIASKNTHSAENLSGESTRLKGIFDMLNELVKGSEAL